VRAVCGALLNCARLQPRASPLSCSVAALPLGTHSDDMSKRLHERTRDGKMHTQALQAEGYAHMGGKAPTVPLSLLTDSLPLHVRSVAAASHVGP
jgi:hypothetical protein